MLRRVALSWLALALSLAWGAAAAEISFPGPAPYATVSQWLGLTHITVGYYSPAVAGRPVWGGVIKPDVPWLMGEGAAPTVSFSRDVVLGGVPLAAGTYALIAIPSAGDWTIVVSRQNRIWRGDARDPRLDVARVTAQVEVAPPRERLTFLFTDFTDDQATLNLEWDKIRVRMSIALHTEEQVRAELQALDGAWRSYADIAAYWLQKGKDLDTGLAYVNQSLVLRETWYNVWLEASLLAAKGDYPGARAAAERAYQLGRAAGEGFTLESTVREALAAWPTVPADTAVAVDDQGGEPFPASVEWPAEARRSPAAKPPSASAFSPIIKRAQRDLQRCYQRALRRDPALSTGKVTVSIGVGTSGRVTKVVLEPSLAPGGFDSCIQDAVRRWTFPASPVEYETQVPLVLNGHL